MDLTETKTEYKPKSFEATLEVAAENADAVVVHGWICDRTRWVLHAWCEIGDHVVDLTETRSPVPKADYYKAKGAAETRTIKYSRLEFFTLVAEHGHLGPFDKEFFFAETASGDPLKKNAGKEALN